jgi:succinate dehydrogenase / fumarate reductase iron-sulfur subunit
MRLHLKVWRQEGPNTAGKFVDYDVDGVSPDMSFLEMLDVLNIDLAKKGEFPVQFDHDCREGICGSCSLVINGAPHGPETGTATCQLHMRRFHDGQTIVVEPWRAKAFPVRRDLCTDRTALDRVIAAGGYVSVNTGNATDGNTHLIGRDTAEEAMDSAACIGCGACVAACKNASAMLFVAAKASHLGHLPQGAPEQLERVKNMAMQMDAEGFGNCSNLSQCEAVCPKEIPVRVIAEFNRDLIKSQLKG